MNTSFVRLTPAKQSRTGFLWNQVPVTMTDWQVLLEFSVSGLRNLGGDGFAFWFVERPEMLGAVYGSTDYWTGLGLFFDTFNNDNLGSSPLISAVYNDGTQRFDYASDGATQALQTCSFDFRNHAQPTAARIRYERKKLTVEIAVNRDSNDQHLFRSCIDVDSLELGTDKFFGVTAHTGDVADNHDVVSLVTSDLTPTDADLQKVRESYQHLLTEQHAQPSHQEMQPNEFQHAVLTMLSQMQEEINLVQMTGLHVSDWIYMQEERSGNIGMAGVRPGGQPETGGSKPAGGLAATDLAPLITSSEEATKQLNLISDNQANMLKEIKAMQSAVGGMGRPGRPPLAVGGGGGGGGAELADISRELGDKVKTTTDSVQAMQKRMEEQIQQLKTDLGKIQSGISGIAASAGGGGGGGGSVSAAVSDGGLGWLPYLMLSFTTFCVASLTYHTFTQHMKNQRYKMI